MAISTLDALLAAMPAAQKFPGYKSSSMPTFATAVWASLWAASGGTPGAGSLSVGNTTSGAIPTKATTGAFNFNNPGGGNFSYLARAVAAGAAPGQAMLFDRAWHAGSFTPTSGAMAGFTGATVPNRPTDGPYELWAEINTALSAAAHTLTITYVNQAGVGSRTATISLPASATSARLLPAQLQDNDTGVRSISAISGSASPPTGTYNLLLLRRLLECPVPLANAPYLYDFTQLGLPRVYDDACLMMAWLQTTGATNPLPQLTFDLVQG